MHRCLAEAESKNRINVLHLMICKVQNDQSFCVCMHDYEVVSAF